MPDTFPHFVMLNSSVYAEAPLAFYAIRTIDVRLLFEKNNKTKSNIQISIHLFDLMLIPFSCIAVIRAGSDLSLIFLL